MLRLAEDVYNLLYSFTRHNCDTSPTDLPENGIYFFFEDGEDILPEVDLKRVVRIGSNRLNGRFRQLIWDHYGNTTTFSGNRKNSAFRKHYGAAFLRKQGNCLNENDIINKWLAKDNPKMQTLEEDVSRLLQNYFTFTCLRIDDDFDRLNLEKGLIALLAQNPLKLPSVDWLGRYAVNKAIVRSGLWNIQHTQSKPLNHNEYQIFLEYAKMIL